MEELKSFGSLEISTGKKLLSSYQPVPSKEALKGNVFSFFFFFWEINNSGHLHWKHHKLIFMQGQRQEGAAARDLCCLEYHWYIYIRCISHIREARCLCRAQRILWTILSRSPVSAHCQNVAKDAKESAMVPLDYRACFFFSFPGSANPKFILLHSTFFSLRWIHGLKGLPLSAEGGLASPFEVCSVIAQRQTLSRYGLT